MYLFFNTNTHSRQWRENKKNEQNDYDEGAEVVHKEKKVVRRIWVIVLEAATVLEKWSIIAVIQSQKEYFIFAEEIRTIVQ